LIEERCFTQINYHDTATMENRAGKNHTSEVGHFRQVSIDGKPISNKGQQGCDGNADLGARF
jgi:hypothetical protein